MSQTLNLKFDWKAVSSVVGFHPRMLFSVEKFLFLVGQHYCKATFFQSWPAQITKIIKVMLTK